MKNGTGVKCVHLMCSIEDDLANINTVASSCTPNGMRISLKPMKNWLSGPEQRKNVLVQTTHPVVTVNHN